MPLYKARISYDTGPDVGGSERGETIDFSASDDTAAFVHVFELEGKDLSANKRDVSIRWLARVITQKGEPVG